jgi:hypothetical protein
MTRLQSLLKSGNQDEQLAALCFFDSLLSCGPSDEVISSFESEVVETVDEMLADPKKRLRELHYRLASRLLATRLNMGADTWSQMLHHILNLCTGPTEQRLLALRVLTEVSSRAREVHTE